MHTLTLTVTNAHGLVDSDEVVLNIVERGEHFVYADAGLDRTIYVGETVNFSPGRSRSVGSSIRYEWTEGEVVLNNTNGHFNYPDTSQPGTHILTLNVTNTQGLVDSDEVVLNIVERGENFVYADAGLDRTVYVGDRVSFSPCLLYTSPSPRDRTRSRMPSSA